MLEKEHMGEQTMEIKPTAGERIGTEQRARRRGSLKRKIALGSGAGVVALGGAGALLKDYVPPAIIEEVKGQMDWETAFKFLKDRQKAQTVEKSPWWGKIYTVRSGDTMSTISQEVYGNFNLVEILRGANQQDPKKNLSLFPGQELYIPRPDENVHSFAVGEEIKPLEVSGKTGPTKLVGIKPDPQNPQEKVLEIFYINGTLPVPLKEGEEFATDRHWQVVMGKTLRAMPAHRVPERVVLRDLGRARW